MVTVGNVTKRPVVVDDEIKVRDVVFLTITADRRFLGGTDHAGMYKKFTGYLADPFQCAALDAGSATTATASL